MDPKDPKTMTDAELEAQVNADVIKTATQPADPTAKEPDKTDPKDPDPKKPDPASDPDPKKDDDPAKGTIQDGIKVLLEKKNTEKRLKDEALKTVADKEKIIADQQKIIDELKNPKDDDKMSDEERNQKLQEAITKKTIAEDRKEEALNQAKAIDTTDETKRNAEIEEFFAKNPDLSAKKTEITDLANAYPNLPMDQVNKLRIANTDPVNLLSEQDLNKIKWGYNLAWKFDKTKVAWKKPDDMSNEELENELNQQFAGWKDILGGG